MRVKEIKRIPKKDILIPEDIMRPLENEEDDDIKGLSTSIDSNGMINEIDVRLKNGKYELMAGARRFVATKEDDVLCKVFEDVSDLKAMSLGLTENLQRKNPDPNIRDHYIYKIWKKGKDEGAFKSIRDLSAEIGMTEHSLRIIIGAEETKEKSDSQIIKEATSWDLEKTKVLSNETDLREELLKKEQDNRMTSENMEKISKEMKSELDKGVDKKVVKRALELSIKEANKISPAARITDKAYSMVLDTYKNSPEDVKEKWEKGEIDHRDAKDLKKFDTPERRDVVLREIKTIDKHKKISEEIHENDRKMNIDIREKQQEDLNKKNQTDLKTKFDLEKERKIELEKSRDVRHDQAFVDKFTKIESDTLNGFSFYHPRHLKTKDGKIAVISIIKNLYNMYRQVLIDMDEIKGGGAGIINIDNNIDNNINNSAGSEGDSDSDKKEVSIMKRT